MMRHSGLVALVLVLCAAGARAQIPTAEFVSEKVYVYEDSGIAYAQIRLSGTVLGASSVQAQTADGTADIDDYVDTGQPATWYYGQTGIREIAVEVRVDAVVEPDENFFIDLQAPGNGFIALGERTRCEVVIVNDDDDLRPFFELTYPIRVSAGGAGAYLAEDGAMVDLTVRINAPAPPGFYASYTMDDGPVQQLPFATGSTQATLTVDPPTEVAPGFEFGVREVRIVEPGPARRAGQTFADLVVGGYRLLGAHGCAICLIQAVSYGITGNDACPAACGVYCPGDSSHRAVAQSPVDVLRAYRDGVLATTHAGQYYTQLYGQLSGDIALEMFANPDLFFQFMEARGEWIPAFQSLVDGTGNSYLVSPSMEASLGAILDSMESSGRSSLVDAAQFERQRLSLDSIAGLTMNQLQARLETLGGGVPAESRSWGSLKSNYDD